MDFLVFRGAADMVQKTKLSVGECLKIVEVELQKLKEREET